MSTYFFVDDSLIRNNPENLAFEHTNMHATEPIGSGQTPSKGVDSDLTTDTGTKSKYAMCIF